MARKDRHRGRPDAAGIGPYVRKDARLVPLSELDNYKVADGEPDIRGWEVRTISGRQLGEVAELLVDPELGEVVVLDVDTKRDGRHGFAPVRAAMIDQTARVVRLDSGDLHEGDLAREAAGREAAGQAVESEVSVERNPEVSAGAGDVQRRSSEGGTVRYSRREADAR